MMRGATLVSCIYFAVDITKFLNHACVHMHFHYTVLGTTSLADGSGLHGEDNVAINTFRLELTKLRNERLLWDPA